MWRMIPIIGKKKPYLYDGIEHASKEEIYFRWYLDDLKDAGIVTSFEYQPGAWVLSEGAKVVQLVKLKTKTKTVERPLFQAKTYMPDFFIFFNGAHPAIMAFYEDLEKYNLTRKPADIPFLGGRFCCSVDIKPNYERDSARSRAFSLIQAWVFHLYNIYVQPIVYQKLFEKTFTPARFLLTDRTGKARKINFKVRSLQEFID